MRDFDLVVIGAGLAGLTAGMYGARYGLSTVIVDQMGSGGQILNAGRIEVEHAEAGDTVRLRVAAITFETGYWLALILAVAAAVLAWVRRPPITPDTPLMRCPACGAEVAAGDRWCSSCGRQLAR